MGVRDIESGDDVAGARGIKRGLDSAADFQGDLVEVGPGLWI